MTASPLAVARACLQAYVDKNRAAIEALIADTIALQARSIIHSTVRPTSKSAGPTARQ
jgi:hypothetical protein